MSNANAVFEMELDAAYKATTEAEVDIIRRKLALQVLAGITEMMPVDTGRARGNTIVSVGHPDHTYSDATNKDVGSVVTKGEAEIMASDDPFDVIYVQNNLPYIERLEAGHSKIQAPFGMMAVTLARLQVQFT